MVFYLAFTNRLPLGWAADHYVELLTASTIFSVSLAVALHASSHQPGTTIAHGAQTDSGAFNFWMGRPLNPRVGGVDLKEFCELYPGLMGWMLLNLAMAHKQFTSTGDVRARGVHATLHEPCGVVTVGSAQVSHAMALVCLFQLVYVCDALWSEASVLTTMDITSEGFGFMLVFGDLTWVPFVYSIHARFLLHHPQARGQGWGIHGFGRRLDLKWGRKRGCRRAQVGMLTRSTRRCSRGSLRVR